MWRPYRSAKGLRRSCVQPRAVRQYLAWTIPQHNLDRVRHPRSRIIFDSNDVFAGNNVEQSGSNSSLTVVGDREGTHLAGRKKKKKGNATSAGPLTAPLPESTQKVDIAQKGAKVQERKPRSKQVRRPATLGANVDREVSPSSSLDIPLATRAVKPIEGRPPLPENTARNTTTKIKRAKFSTIPEPDLNIVEGRSCPTLKQASPDQLINYPFGDEASPEPYAPTATEEFHVPAAVDLRDMGEDVRDSKILSSRVTIVTEAVDGLPREPPRITADVAVGMQVITTAPTSGHVNGNPDSSMKTHITAIYTDTHQQLVPTAAPMSNPKPPLAQYPPIWAQVKYLLPEKCRISSHQVSVKTGSLRSF